MARWALDLCPLPRPSWRRAFFSGLSKLALKFFEDGVAMQRRMDVSWIGEPKSGQHGESAVEARPAIANANG